ncbi:MAG: DUF3617 family protein [Aliidongia sp.]
MLRNVALASLLSLAFTAGACADTIHAGNWEFTTETKMPGMSVPTPTAGARLPPGVTIGPNGISRVHNGCISAAQPFPAEPGNQCTLEKNERHGNTVIWAATCTTAHGQVHAEGAATYTGDTMDGRASFQIMGKNGQTVDTTTHTTGHYLGACPG